MQFTVGSTKGQQPNKGHFTYGRVNHAIHCGGSPRANSQTKAISCTYGKVNDANLLRGSTKGQQPDKEHSGVQESIHAIFTWAPSTDFLVSHKWVRDPFWWFVKIQSINCKTSFRETQSWGSLQCLSPLSQLVVMTLRSSFACVKTLSCSPGGVGVCKVVLRWHRSETLHSTPKMKDAAKTTWKPFCSLMWHWFLATLLLQWCKLTDCVDLNAEQVGRIHQSME